MVSSLKYTRRFTTFDFAKAFDVLRLKKLISGHYFQTFYTSLSQSLSGLHYSEVRNFIGIMLIKTIYLTGMSSPLPGDASVTPLPTLK